MEKMEKFFCWMTKQEYDISELGQFKKLEVDKYYNDINKNNLKVGLSNIGSLMLEEERRIREEHIMTNEDEIRCPYCQTEFIDSYEGYGEDDDDDVYCDTCGKNFQMEVERTIVYKTYTMEYDELIKRKNIKKKVLEDVSRETLQKSLFRGIGVTVIKGEEAKKMKSSIIIPKENDTNE